MTAPAGGARRASRGLAAALLALAAAAAPAASLRYCDDTAEPSPAHQDRLLRLAALVRQELQADGARVALVARTGLDLARFGIRYSHAGISLRAHPRAPWAVRQLFYACDERRPRLFDQGLAGFVLGGADAEAGFVSLLMLPDEAAASLEPVALQAPAALALLGGDYSANANPFSTRYQNCNQWVAELMATAWGGPGDPGERADRQAPRERAQRWLREAGYQPARVQVRFAPLMLAGVLVPWLHRDDHPLPDLEAGVFSVSLPHSLEAFAQARWPQARRIEICHLGTRVLVRRGGPPIADGCRREPGDIEHEL